MADWVINCPQLVNLVINDHLTTYATHLGKILVTSQKICNFSSFGFFPITFAISELVNVNIKLCDGYIGYRTSKTKENMKRYFFQVTNMFPGLCSARTLTIDLETIELSKIPLAIERRRARLREVEEGLQLSSSLPQGKSAHSPSMPVYGAPLEHEFSLFSLSPAIKIRRCSLNYCVIEFSVIFFGKEASVFSSTLRPVEENKTSSQNENVVAPASEARVVGWPPIQSFRKNTLATRLVQEVKDHERL